MPITIVQDDFNRANDPLGLGTAPTGQTWICVTSNNPPTTWQIISGQACIVNPAFSAGQSGYALVDTGQINGYTEVVLGTPELLSSAASGMGIVVRAQSTLAAAAYWRLVYYRWGSFGATPTLYLQINRSGGSWATVWSEHIVLTTGDVIGLSYCGQDFEVFVNGVSQTTYHYGSTPIPAGTHSGLIYIAPTIPKIVTISFDDFLVTTLDSCGGTDILDVDLPVPIFTSTATVTPPAPPAPPQPIAGLVCWMYDTRELVKGWFQYKFSPGMLVPYFEEGVSTLVLGGNDGRAYLYGGDDDAGEEIPAEFDTFTFDADDPRSNKQFTNGGIEAMGTIDIEAIADNQQTSLGTTAFSETDRTRRILDFTQEEHRNLMLKVTGDAPWTVFNYSHEYAFVGVSELTEARKAYATSVELAEYGHLYRAQIAAICTADITITVIVDNGAPQTYTLPNTGGATVKAQVVFQALKGKLFEVSFSSAADLQIIRSQSVFFFKEFRSTGPYDLKQPFGDVTPAT